MRLLSVPAEDREDAREGVKEERDGREEWRKGRKGKKKKSIFSQRVIGKDKGNTKRRPHECKAEHPLESEVRDDVG